MLIFRQSSLFNNGLFELSVADIVDTADIIMQEGEETPQGNYITVYSKVFTWGSIHVFISNCINLNNLKFWWYSMNV